MTTHEPVCGHCNYPVQGLPTLTCPECGSDVRKVGIRLPGQRRFPSVAGPLLAWMLLTLLPALMTSAILSGLVSRVTYHYRHDFVPSDSLAATPLQKLTLSYSDDHLRWIFPSHHSLDNITLQIFVASHPSSSLVLDGNGYITSSTPARLFDASASLDWLGSAGMDVGQIQTQQIAGDIAATISRLRASPHDNVSFVNLSSSGGSDSSSSGPVGWIEAIPIIIAAVVFLLLVRRVMKFRQGVIHTPPTCGFCRYPADKITTLFCPQCKHDVRIDGIKVTRTHPYSRIAAPLALCSILVMIGAIAVTRFMIITQFDRLASTGGFIITPFPSSLPQLQWIIWLLLWLTVTWFILRRAKKRRAIQ